MKRRIFGVCLICIFLLYVKSLSQSNGFSSFIINPGAISSSNINELGYISNPALCSEIDKGFAFLSYSPSKFGIKSLSPGLVLGGFRISDIFTMAAGFYGIGDELFIEYSAYGAVGWTPGQYLKVGLSAEYIGIKFTDFGSDAQIKLNVGGLINLTQDLEAGVSLMNINRGHYEGGNNTTEQSAVMGLGYSILDDVKIGINGIVRLNSSSGFSMVGKFIPFDNIELLISYLTQPQIISLGINWASSDWLSVSFLIYYHNYLGFVNNPGLSFYF